MSDVPRRLPPTGEERLRVLGTGQAGGSNLGQTRFGKRPERRRGVGQDSGSSFVVVEHGDDSTVGRPSAAVVYWVGAATPDNGLDFDFWYSADVAD